MRDKIDEITFVGLYGTPNYALERIKNIQKIARIIYAFE